MANEKVQNNAAAQAAQQPGSEKLELLIVDGYLIIPTLYITREEYQTNKGNKLWSYGVEVTFYGEKKNVGLQTPSNTDNADGRWNKDRRDKYGYSILDPMFEVLGKVPLGIKINRNSEGEVRSVEYYACGLEKVGDKYTLPDHIPMVTQKSSSEALLRSAINRLAITNDWDLPRL